MIRPTTTAMTDLLHESLQLGGDEGYGNYEAEGTLAPTHTIKRDGRYVQGGRRYVVGTFWREDHNTAPTWRKLDGKSLDSERMVPSHEKKQAPSTALSRRQSEVFDYCQNHESVPIRSVARTIAHHVFYLHRFSPGHEIATAEAVCDRYLAVFHLFSQHSDPRVKNLAKAAGYNCIRGCGLDMTTSRYTPTMTADKYLAMALCILDTVRAHPDIRIQALDNFLVRAFFTYTTIAGIAATRLWVERAIAYNVNIWAARDGRAI